jgi:hypothetical protein
LVAIERQRMAAALIDNLPGGAALAIERVHGHGTALQRQHFQELGN